jgi:hypothetical protein
MCERCPGRRRARWAAPCILHAIVDMYWKAMQRSHVWPSIGGRRRCRVVWPPQQPLRDRVRVQLIFRKTCLEYSPTSPTTSMSATTSTVPTSTFKSCPLLTVSDGKAIYLDSGTAPGELYNSIFTPSFRRPRTH